MKGYRSLIAQVPVLIFAILALFGVVVPEADQAILVAAASSIIAVAMRMVTSTPVGQSS